MGEPSGKGGPRPARRSSLLASIGAVEHPAEVHTEGHEPVGRVNDNERLVAFAPLDPAAPVGDTDPPAVGAVASDPFAEFEAALAATYPPPAAPAVGRPPRRRLSARQLRWSVLGAALVLLAVTLVVVFWSGPACCGDDRSPLTRRTGAPGVGPRSAGDGSAGTSTRPSVDAGEPGGATASGATPGAADAPAPQATGAAGGAAATQAPRTTAPAAGGGDSGADGLTAHYRTSKPSLLGLLGYQGEITLRNPTSRPIGSWTVVVELRSGNQVSTADGALYLHRDGQYWFIPPGAGTIQPGGTYTFTFDVSGALTGDPASCAVNDRPCA
jgi:hypothetical protein